MSTLVRHLKKGDTVVALSGAAVGKTGKVLEVNQGQAMVKVEGMGATKRHTKPSQSNPKGGVVEGNRWFHASKFQVCSDSGKKLGRVGFQVEKDGDKKRVFSGARSKK